MSTSGNAGGKKIACNLVEHINLASRAVLETALQTDDQVDKTIAFDMDLNLLMKNVPLAKTGGRSLSEYFEVSEIAKDQIDRALESTPEKPGSSLPYASLSDWQPFVAEGDVLDAGSIFTAANKSGDAEPFSKIIEQEILEMRTLQNSGGEGDDEGGATGNTQIIEGVVPKWLDEKDGIIVGNVDTNGTPHKNFLHSFLSSSQLDELVRSSVELSLYCTPQPNEMVSGGEDTSEESVAKAHDSLNNRDDFGKVYPQPTSRWTSFLKLREDDLWIFKLRLSIHDDDLSAGSPSSSRLYRFIFRQKDTVPSSITAVDENISYFGDDAIQKWKFVVEAPAHAPAANEIEYTGSLTHLGVHLTQDDKAPADVQYLVDPNTLFHTGERLKQGHLQGTPADLQDGFLCALVPASQDTCVELVRPIFAVAQAAIKEMGKVGTITQLHPIQDLDAQVSRYVEQKRCLVVPASDWHQMKDPADSSRRVQKLFDDGEQYRMYPTCHVRVQCGSGVEFELQFGIDEDGPTSDPNQPDLQAVRLTGVKLVDGGSGYLTFSQDQKNDPDFYTFYLQGSSGEYMPYQVEDGKESFHDFMMSSFEVNSTSVWGYVDGASGVIAYPTTNQRIIMAADESEMSVELRQGDRVCHFTSMSEAIQLPLFHNQDVQADGTPAKINTTSFSPYTHTFQNTDADGKTYQPIQQNMVSSIDIEYPPHKVLEAGGTGENYKVFDEMKNLEYQYAKATPYVETGGHSERGGNYTLKNAESPLPTAYTNSTDFENAKQPLFGGTNVEQTNNPILKGALQHSFMAHRYMNSRRLVLNHALPGLNKGSEDFDVLVSRVGSYILLPIEDEENQTKYLFALYEGNTQGEDLWADEKLQQAITAAYDSVPLTKITMNTPDTATQMPFIFTPYLGDNDDPILDNDGNQTYFDLYGFIRDDVKLQLKINDQEVIKTATKQKDDLGDDISSTFQLKKQFRFWRKPTVCEPTDYGIQSFFQIPEEDNPTNSACRMDSWGFASRGIHFERLDAEAVRALSQAERDALPSVRVSDPETGSTQIAVRLVEVEKSASTVNIEFFMGYGMEVDVEILRDYLYKTQGYDGDLFLDYTVQVQFSKPEISTDYALEHVNNESFVTVDTAAKTITLNIVVGSNNAMLRDQSDNSEITLGDVHRLLQVYSDIFNHGDEAGEGCVTITFPANRVLRNYDDATILSGGGGDVWFESAHTFSHGGAQVTLPCRYWEPKQVDLLKAAFTAFENGCRTGLVPQDNTKYRLKDQMTSALLIEGLQDYFTDAGADAKVAEFAFYGEIAVHAVDDESSQTHLAIGTATSKELGLTLCDTNLLKPDTLVTARFGEFLYAHHAEAIHGKRPHLSLQGDSNILPFEEAAKELTYENIPRTYVLRAYKVATGSDAHELVIDYNRDYLKKPRDTSETVIEKMSSLPLVCDADQRILMQATFEQK